MMIIEINRENFEKEVLNSNIPAVLDFWAPWCGPCLLIDPIMEEMTLSYAEKVKICRINVDEEGISEIAAHYNVTGLPTIKFFKRGQVADEIIGAVRKEMVVAAIEKMIDNEDAAAVSAGAGA